MRIMTAKSKRFEETTKKLHRLIAILRILDTRKRCTPQTLANEFKTTERNVYRDINDLNASGFSITFDKTAGTYRFTDTDFTLRDLDLNKEELMALLVGRQVAGRLGKPFENTFQSLFKKVKKDTGPKTQGRFKALADEGRFWIDIDEADGFDSIERQYRIINKAMDENVAVKIVYHAMNSDEESTRVVSPYGLVYDYGLWYMIGYCHLRNDIRVFALDCIKDIRLTDRHYAIPEGFNIAEHFKPGWQMLRYGAPVEVVVEFTKHYARWIKRRKWHPTQKIKEQPDGSLIFKVIVEGTREFKWWLYHWIPHCKVLSPPELRDEMIGEMREMVSVYEDEKK